MKIDLSSADAEVLLDSLSAMHTLNDYDFIGLDRDWRKSEPLILLFAKLIHVARSHPKRPAARR